MCIEQDKIFAVHRTFAHDHILSGAGVSDQDGHSLPV
jgi:hypothetical protein